MKIIKGDYNVYVNFISVNANAYKDIILIVRDYDKRYRYIDLGFSHRYINYKKYGINFELTIKYGINEHIKI
jgi:hypothetical protein